MCLAKNIRYLRKKHNLSQDYLADKFGFKSYTTIQKWEMGISEPSIKILTELAEMFNVDMDDLASVDLEMVDNGIEAEKNSKKKKGVRIPVLGHVAAGIPIEAIEDIIDYEDITEEMAHTGKYFGLQIKGDSMAPNICDGDVVIVKSTPDAENGDTVIVQVNGDQATCKRLRKFKTGIELVSNNPAYEPFEFSNKDIVTKPVTIIGKVVELRRKF